MIEFTLEELQYLDRFIEREGQEDSSAESGRLHESIARKVKADLDSAERTDYLSSRNE